MPVKFIDSATDTTFVITIPGETYDEVCERAWDEILEGRVEADDFLVMIDD